MHLSLLRTLAPLVTVGNDDQACGPWDGQIRHFKKCGDTQPLREVVEVGIYSNALQCQSCSQTHLVLTTTIITNSGRMIRPMCGWLKINMEICNDTAWTLKKARVSASLGNMLLVAKGVESF